ncbi:MAG: RDD family protein [Solirubrobacteraceae bacterium]
MSEESPLPVRSGYGSAPVPPGARARLSAGSPDASTPAPALLGPGQHLLATWGSRVAATLIDLALLLLVAVAIVGLFALVFVTGDATAGTVSVLVGLLVAGFALTVAVLLYPPLIMARWDGQTLGKRLCAIRVVNVSGEPMDLGSAMLREVAIKWIGIVIIGSSFTFGVAALIDMLWPLWDGERRAVHDILARTLVVRSDER